MAYLFADTEEKIAAGVCGSGVSDDNRFTYDAHIGFWNKGDNFYTLVQGQNTKKEDELYFYEELENGVTGSLYSGSFRAEFRGTTNAGISAVGPSGGYSGKFREFL